MPTRKPAVHVATTKRRYKDRVHTTHLLRRSYREDGKVRNTTVGDLSHLPESVIDLVRRALLGETLVPAEAAPQVLRSRPHGHVAAVLGTLRALGLERLLGARRNQVSLCPEWQAVSAHTPVLVLVGSGRPSLRNRPA
jgi:hypothetical protein